MYVPTEQRPMRFPKQPQRQQHRANLIDKWGYNPDVENWDGVPYAGLKWGSCFKLAFAFLIVFSIPALVLMLLAAA